MHLAPMALKGILAVRSCADLMTNNRGGQNVASDSETATLPRPKAALGPRGRRCSVARNLLVRLPPRSSSVTSGCQAPSLDGSLNHCDQPERAARWTSTFARSGLGQDDLAWGPAPDHWTRDDRGFRRSKQQGADQLAATRAAAGVDVA